MGAVVTTTPASVHKRVPKNLPPSQNQSINIIGVLATLAEC